MKSIIILIFVFSIQVYSQSYLNIHYTDDSYKYAAFSSIQKITFGAGGDQLIVLLTDETLTTEDLNTIAEITYDDNPMGEPLPVELTSFIVKMNGDIITLFWTTETEVANYGFDVERKTQNTRKEIGTWEKIGFVEGHGNSNSPKEYSFADDNHPSGKIQYRLKQIDTDGSYEYSSIVSVEFETPNDYELKQNFPNPFNPFTKIRYSIPIDGFVTLKVFDVLGREVVTLLHENKKAGSYEVLFNASQLASGLYICKMSSVNYSNSIKMLITK